MNHRNHQLCFWPSLVSGKINTIWHTMLTKTERTTEFSGGVSSGAHRTLMIAYAGLRAGRMHDPS